MLVNNNQFGAKDSTPDMGKGDKVIQDIYST